jgi:hypothetical protein
MSYVENPGRTVFDTQRFTIAKVTFRCDPFFKVYSNQPCWTRHHTNATTDAPVSIYREIPVFYP